MIDPVPQEVNEEAAPAIVLPDRQQARAAYRAASGRAKNTERALARATAANAVALAAQATAAIAASIENFAENFALLLNLSDPELIRLALCSGCFFLSLWLWQIKDFLRFLWKFSYITVQKAFWQF